MSELVDRTYSKFSFPEMNRLTRQAIEAYDGDLSRAWQDARGILSSKASWHYEGDTQLDDTADNNYFTRIPVADRNAVLAGIFSQMIEGKSLFLKSAGEVPNTGMCELMMSVASVETLKTIVRSMDVKGGFTTAGRADEPSGIGR